MNNLVIEIYGEFEYIVRAFQLIAHLFSPNSSYLGLIGILGIIAIFFTGAFAIGSSTMGKGNIQTWFMYVVGTSALIMVLTVPKSTITISDISTNQFRTVGGIPTVMATVAAIENKIEQTVTQAIESVMQPILPYDVIGKGTGFELLATMDKAGKEFFNLQPYTGRSIQDYWQKCVVPDLSLGFMSEDAIYKTDDIWKSIKSTTKVRQSTVYLENKTSKLETCDMAWSSIDKQITDTDMVAATQKICADKYNNDPDAMVKCVSSLRDIVGGLIAPTSNLNSYLRSYLVSWSMMSSAGVLEKALADVNQKYISSAMMAEKQIPRLKGVLYGMIIGIFPILILFIWFNPVKTTTFYLGMFVLLILWSAIDTFMDMQYQNEVVNLFATMRRQGLGVHQMFDISSVAADAVALYGSSRWLALGLATAISTAITGISSYAISQMGSQLASTAQGAAAANAGFMSSSGQFQQRSQTMQDQANRELLDGFTVANYQGLSDTAAQGQWSNSMTGSALNQHFGGNVASGVAAAGMSVTNTLMGIGSAGAKSTQASALGLSNEQYGAFSANNHILTNDVAKTLNSQFGVKTFNEGQRLTAGFGENGELKNMSVDYMDGKTKVTQMLDNNGQLAMTSKHGGNYDNYSLDHKSGYEKGAISFTKDGVGHTIKYDGSRSTDISSQNGQAVTVTSAKVDGEWVPISRQIGNDTHMSNEAMQMIVQKGDASLIKDIMYDGNGQLTSEGRVIISDSARALEQMYSKSKSSYTNLGGNTPIGGIGTSENEQASKIYTELLSKAESLNSTNFTSVQKAEIFSETVANTFAAGREYADKNMPMTALDTASTISEKFQDALNKADQAITDFFRGN